MDTLRYGMLGGGRGAFIGEVHRKAVALDGLAVLAAGCFSSDIENTRETGRALGLDSGRLYDSYRQMAEREAAREDGVDFVVIASPNYLHHPMAKAFLEHGIHVVCDKPLCLELAEAEELARLARERNLLFGVTYTYTGYPMAKQARRMIQNNELGAIRVVHVEYLQDWLSTRLEITGHKQASWRGDPALGGKANCLGDIGTHVENMAAFMTGLKIRRLSARLDSLVPGRTLDDNATVMVDYEGGAKGVYLASQVAVGNKNGLRIRIYGEHSGLEWDQENPDQLTFTHLGRPTEILFRGRDSLYPEAQAFSRIPAGHPEGVFEAFANIYSGFIRALALHKSGVAPSLDSLDFPTVEDGLSGVRFIHRCLESSARDSAWVDF